MATAEQEVRAYLDGHNRKDLLRFLTCGSVDDGKSTLIGRLLHDSKLVYEDTLESLRKDSARRGSAGGEVDYSLLVDGLKAEREQGITIDVAYRYFSTPSRKFIIADTPGHEQYTRNMATGASTCDLAVILIDARQGVLTQTRRHSFIVSLLGIRHVVVAINKMDLVDYDEAVFNAIRDDYRAFVSRIGFTDLHFVPLSALKGDNVVERSAAMPWYLGKPLLNHLETVHIGSDRNLVDFRLPVQYVNRPHHDFRGFCGTVSSGVVRCGDEIMVLPSRQHSRVARLLVADQAAEQAFAPMAVTVTLEDEVDVSRGDLLVHPDNIPHVAREFEAMLVWMAETPLRPQRNYLFKQGTSLVSGSFETLRYRVDVNTLRQTDCSELGLNEIARVAVSVTRPLCFDPYAANRMLGNFIVIDPLTNATAAAGMIIDRVSAREVLDTEATNQALQELRSRVTPEQRQARMGQVPFVVWLTGLAKANKGPVAVVLEEQLFELGYVAAVLNGSDLRHDLNRDLGFSGEDRSENTRRVAAAARLLNQAGVIAVVSLTSPFAADRQRAAERIGVDRFLEIHAAAPLDACRERDQEGLYEAADAGRIRNLPGVQIPYEPPRNPALELPTHLLSTQQAVDEILTLLRERGLIH